MFFFFVLCPSTLPLLIAGRVLLELHGSTWLVSKRHWACLNILCPTSEAECCGEDAGEIFFRLFYEGHTFRARLKSWTANHNSRVCHIFLSFFCTQTTNLQILAWSPLMSFHSYIVNSYSCLLLCGHKSISYSKYQTTVQRTWLLIVGTRLEESRFY